MNHLLGQPNTIPIHMSSTAMDMGQNDSSISASNVMRSEGISQPQAIIFGSKKLEEGVQVLGRKIKKYEDDILFLKSQKNSLDDSILDLRVNLGIHHSSTTPMAEDGTRARSEEDTVQQIMQHTNSAAGILCWLKTRHESQASHLRWSKDVLGVVATLGKVDDENLSRLLSEYLGITKMLAVVCKTYEGVQALEHYESDGSIIASSGLHGLGTSTGRNLNERFIVICLEDIRPYCGDFITNDPQRRLDLVLPKLPNGECPPGFIGFAVNMITVDNSNLSCLTTTGQGLRETLFYNLFSRLQVYRTRADMLRARPCITDGAISLDGGIIKRKGMYFLRNREEIGVNFPSNCGPPSEDHSETEKRIEEMKWRRERLVEDIRRVQELLNHAKKQFETKRREFHTFLAQSAAYATQVNPQT